MKSLLFVLLLLGATSVSVSAVGILALVGSAAKVVSTVSSVAYIVFSRGTTMVTCDILIENWTKWTLHDQRTYVGGGSVSETSGLNIPSATKKKLMGKKTQSTATGTYGVTSWQVGPASLNRRVWVMWSVPYDRLFYPSNWLAVGISSATFTDTFAAYDRMSYRYNNTDDLVFNRQYYQYGVSSNNAAVRDSNTLIVEGSMGTDQHPTARIIVRPQHDNDLAVAILNRLNGRG